MAGYVASVIPGCPLDRVVSTTQFNRGEDHAVYRVSYLDAADIERVVVSTSNSGSDADRVRAEREAAVLARMGGRSSPRLLDFPARRQNDLRPDQREGFWRGYGGGLDAAARSRVVERLRGGSR